MQTADHLDTYEIRVQGSLSPRWRDWFGGMIIEHAADGTMVLRGQLPDQAALHGILMRIRDLGLPLLSVQRLEAGPQSSPDDAG